VVAEIAHRLEDLAQPLVVGDVVTDEVGIAHDLALLMIGSSQSVGNDIQVAIPVYRARGELQLGPTSSDPVPRSLHMRNR
jgi:hypothetical protein